MAEPIFPAGEPPDDRRRPLLGYAMVAGAATLFGVNGSVAKLVIESGLAADRLTEIRCAGALAGLALLAVLTRRHELRAGLRQLTFLAVFGIAGVALVQWTFFVAIGRLHVGVALVIQYVAPLVVALFARFVYHEDVRRRIWISLALSLTGLVLVVRLWAGLTLDGVGLAAGVGAMLTFALYVLMAERGIRSRSSIPLLAYGFLFASLFWSVVLPWWSFPGRSLSTHVSTLGAHPPVWLLVGWVIVLGTIAPFALLVGALRHVSATRVGIVAMLEPVAGTIVAWLWLGETLAAVQLVGAAFVLVAIGIAQTAR
jgi:drug/metabolite transporter (DMT)-like permease